MGSMYMRSDPEIHHRTFPRSKAYDYSPAGGHFVTLVAFGRQNLFGDVVEGKMRVHALGRIEHECWQDIPLHFPNVEIEKFVVMPDHVHGVIFILENNSARVGAQHDLKESKILS
jgi:REP element-mobilizing transposase RayT